MEVAMNVKFVTEGFKPSEIRPTKMWKRLQEDFLEVYNDYCEESNSIIPQLNEKWQATHPATEEENNDKELTAEEAEIEELKTEIEMLQYGIYMANHFSECVFRANQKHPNSYLEGFIFMDGDCPYFGARIKQHPECSMSFVLEDGKK